MDPRTIVGFIELGEHELRAAGIDDARLESELLLAHALSIPRVRLHVVRDSDLDSVAAERFFGLLSRRKLREPTAYLLGRREFYSLEFNVGEGVLVPRPDTETLVDCALEVLKARSTASVATVVDVGTGSGAIAIAIAVNSPGAFVVAIDRSAVALGYARRNAARLLAADRIGFLEADLKDLARLLRPQSIEILVSNPPYVALDQVRDELAHEPPLALVGNCGPFPSVYERLIAAAPALVPGGAFLAEVGVGQAETIAQLARESSYFERVETVRDLSGIERVVRAIRKK